MDPARFARIDESAWRIEPVAGMRVPAIVFAADVGSEGAISLDPIEMDHMLAGGAAWAAEKAGLARRVALVKPVICIKG